ncbi:MAG TPA: hypothetical protein VLB44_19115 [Kofleriaceae bacterium]|nr:hypothetical protein [Kofleriaceae bacterium]
MRRSLWVLVVTIACSHPAPTRDDHHEQTRPVAAAPPDPAPQDAANTTEPSGSSDGPEPKKVHAEPVDARVVEKHVEGGKLRVALGLPRGTREGHITVEWTGLFLREGKPISGSAFKLKAVKGAVAHAELAGQELPSDHVRLYEPDYAEGLKQ